MQVKNINNHQNFRAKFFYSEDLKRIADYAVEKQKIQQLNEARKNIDLRNVRTRLMVRIGKNEKGLPFFELKRYEPKRNLIDINSFDDYFLAKQMMYVSSKPMNELKFGLERIIKLGNNFGHNNMFEKLFYNHH